MDLKRIFNISVLVMSVFMVAGNVYANVIAGPEVVEYGNAIMDSAITAQVLSQEGNVRIEGTLNKENTISRRSSRYDIGFLVERYRMSSQVIDTLL